MFCDLADSTRLSAAIDPEDMGDVIRAYQEAVSEAVRRFDDYIAKFMGDGLLVYFGYPNSAGIAGGAELLAPVLGWFTEGFDTAGLKDAKALLHALA